MNTIVKQIDGTNCEIETVDEYTNIFITSDNTRLKSEWIVRKAPEAIAEQIASIVIQHLLLTSESPDEVLELEIIKGDNGNESRHTTPESEAWLKELRSASHDTEAARTKLYMRSSTLGSVKELPFNWLTEPIANESPSRHRALL
jgi:hypothetical protein